MATFNELENATKAFSMNSSTYTSIFNEEGPSSLDMVFFEKIFAGIDVCWAPFIIFGNTLVLIAVYFEPTLRTISNGFIASLAVSDLFVGVITIPLYAMFYLHVANMDSNKYACLFRHSVGLYSLGSSLLNLLLMSFDRYLAVIYPLRYPLLMTTKRVKYAVGFVYIGSSISFLPLTGWNTWTENTPCDLYKVFPQFSIIFVYGLIIVVLVVTSMMYVRIFYEARKHLKRRRAATVSASADFRRKLEKGSKSAKVMCVVLLLFIVFWMPYLICGGLKSVKIIPSELLEVIKNFALCVAFSNSFVNPIVYVLLKRDFNAIFRKYIGLQFHCCKLDGPEDKNAPKSSVKPITKSATAESKIPSVDGLAAVSAALTPSEKERPSVTDESQLTTVDVLKTVGDALAPTEKRHPSIINESKITAADGLPPIGDTLTPSEKEHACVTDESNLTTVDEVPAIGDILTPSEKEHACVTDESNLTTVDEVPAIGDT